MSLSEIGEYFRSVQSGQSKWVAYSVKTGYRGIIDMVVALH